MSLCVAPAPAVGIMEKESLPHSCPLPAQYRAPQIEEYWQNMAFFEVETEYKSLSDVPVGEKGNTCLSCAPGSGPGPFITVYNDGKQMGFIHPYVTVIARQPEDNRREQEFGSFEDRKKEPKDGQVTVQVNGDASNFCDDTIKQVADSYVITYRTYEEIDEERKGYCAFLFGSFGNRCLPDHDGAVVFDGYDIAAGVNPVAKK